MARVIGGIGASHAPSMEHIYDAGDEVRRSYEWELTGAWTTTVLLSFRDGSTQELAAATPCRR